MPSIISFTEYSLLSYIRKAKAILSFYFREPNSILFELATDGPGFATDEHVNHLGENLALPPFLESKREQIEQKLKPLVTK